MSVEIGPRLLEKAARAAYEASEFYAREGIEWEDNHAVRPRYLAQMQAGLSAVAALRDSEAYKLGLIDGANDCKRCPDAYQRGKVDGARQVSAAVEGMVAEWEQVVPPLDLPSASASVLAAAREAVARIEGETK